MDVMLLKAIKSYLKALNIQVSTEELELQLFSNPHTPSLYAISETLDFLGIDNVAVKIEPHQLDELPEHFIVFIDGEDGSPYFSHAQKKGVTIHLKAEKRKISREEFFQIWDGIVLLAEQREVYNSKKTYFPNLIGYFFLALLLVFFWDRPLELAFSTLGLAGMYISLEIFATSNNRSTNFGKKVCGGKDGEGCAKILNSDQYNLGVFTPNDFLFAFLLSSTTLLIISKEFIVPHLIVHSLAILVLFITIGIQAFIVKTWCRLCLVSSAVLLLQGVLVLTYFFYYTIEQSFMFKPIAFQFVLLGLLFGTYLIAVRQYRDIQKKNFSLGLSEMELLKFKRFPKVMRFILKDAEQLPIPNGAEQIVFGNMNAKLQITIILSFTCSFCTNSFLKFYALYQKRGNELRFRIIFNQYDTKNPKFINLANFLINSYEVDSPDLFLKFLKEWYLKKSIGESTHYDSKGGAALLSNHRNWCEKNHLYQTPTIAIDTSIVPYYYSADFLEDFVDVLKDELN